jgi:hypothetical protein
MSYVKKENACDMLNRHFKTLEGNDAQVLVSDIKQDLLELPNASVIEIEDVLAFCKAKKATAKTNWEICSSDKKLDGYEMAMNAIMSYLNNQKKKIT